MSHPASEPIESFLRSCTMTRLRRSGPGGQRRNKVETAVRLTHVPTGLTAEASEARSPERNRHRAIFRLRLKLALAHRCPIKIAAYTPSPALRRHTFGTRLRIAVEHDDLPTILAEVLDVLGALDHDQVRTAELLRISPTQLVKLLAMEPQALEQLNQSRRARGLRPLR